ncbi:MAG: UDP-N-acetylmuramoyl-L-alanyl-D-glutamate--2,6-diaminopimelate ligase [Chlamydiia bacterium]|nr:UDP-N-acetylmuramoyl-L-alanyl-D-glutamate--2,6-diaminopimelate ligase [Chlamydiia bacterium]
MKLKILIRDLPEVTVRGSKETEIHGLSSHSQTVTPGDLFIAKKGLHADGSTFIPQAIEAGASAVLTSFYDPFLKTVQLICPNPEHIEAALATRYYGSPSRDLLAVGVTGTKGKTTSAYLIQHLLNGLGQSCGLMSTIETVAGTKHYPSTLTTHDAIYNQKMLREMLTQGCKAVSMEISSHGLVQGRVDEIEFQMAVFTNLSPDHLDYHQTIEAYAGVKSLLFTRARFGIFNADSPWMERIRQGKEGMTFGIENPADVRAQEIESREREMFFTVTYQGMSARMKTSLRGLFNVSNWLGAIAVGLHLGAPLEQIASIVGKPVQIPGRMELVFDALGVRVYVDFAHTGESLKSALSTVCEGMEGRLIVVFGCGGNRDPRRRKGMAEAAEALADFSILTTDNPRTEDPEKICREILSGFRSKDNVVVEMDRRQAIERAIQMAKQGDVVLIAGKGHETTQIFDRRTVPFDDRLVAKEALNLLRN